MSYKYALSRCKVRDKESLKKFRQLRSDWIDWLHGPIRDEITYMMLDDALYRTLNEAIGLSIKEPRKSAEFNGLVSQLIDRGYVHIQLMSIRKLVSRRKSDISLHTLLTDIRRNRKLITRENYVCYDGLPYDYEPLRLKDLEKRLEASGGKAVTWSSPTTGPRAYGSSERHHNSFDRLSGVGPELRCRDDQLLNHIFSDLFDALKDCEEIERAASENIAHIPSRKIDSRDLITLGNIEKAQRTVCWVAHLIDGPLLCESSSSIVPIPQYGFLQGLDKAWATPSRLPHLYRFWESHTQEVEKWTDGDWP